MSLSRIEELLEMINNKSGPTDMIPLSRTEEILKCYINGVSYTGPITSRFEELLYNTLYKQPSDEQPLSRSEEILKSKIDKTTYEGAILSRVEELLLELKTEPDPVEITIGPDTILHVLNAIEAAVVSLKIDLTPTQDGTPWISDTLNTEPYLSRAAQNGNTADETIVGGTVAWDQLASLDPSKWTRSNVTVSVSEKQFSITPQTSSSGAKKIQVDLQTNHIYLASGYARRESALTTASATICILNSSNSIATTIKADYSDEPYTDVFKYGIKIVKAESGQTFALRTVNSASTSNTLLFKDIQLIDLTQMLGRTVADYVYSLEQANTGAGVAWLKSHGFIDDTYHAYNPGELISAKPTAKVVGDTTYTLGGADLRGLFKLDANNNLYCDGDVYTADGTITRKYGIVDLGTLSYTYYTSGYARFYAQFNDIKVSDELATAHTFGMINNAGFKAELQDTSIPISDVPTYMSGKDNVMWTVNTANGYHGINFICSEYTSAESFKTAMTGKYLVYELATPTTEQSTAYTNPQKAGEAEAFVDARTEKVPVGHSTRYSAEYAINGFEGVTVHVSETQTGGTTYPVTFTSQGTVYGGIVDVVSGEMSITYAIADMGDLEWTYRLAPPYGYVFQAPFTSDYTATSFVTAYAKANPPGINYGEYHLEYSALNIRDPRTTDATEFTRLVTGQKIVYKLVTPITATIDPTTINISEGESYVWAEEGNSTLTYMGIPVTRKRSK